MESKKVINLYNGALFCPCGNSSCTQCPVVEYHPGGNDVVLRDPAKPEKGQFTMTPDEYNNLIENAKKI